MPTVNGSKALLQMVTFMALVAVFTVLPGTSYAEDKIAVVNIQQIMSEAKAAKSIQDQLDKQRKAYLDDLSARERQLDEEGDALVEAKASMSADEFATKKQEFENKILEGRRLVQKRQRALDQAAGESLAKLRDEMMKIVDAIAAEEGYSMVLTGQNVMYVKDDMDITSEILKRLDKNLKTIELKVETN